MDKRRELLLSQLKENKYYKEANWRLHLVYILSGVLQKNYEYLNTALRMMGVKLNPQDQWHITEILKASKEPFIMPSNYIRKYLMKRWREC